MHSRQVDNASYQPSDPCYRTSEDVISDGIYVQWTMHLADMWIDLNTRFSLDQLVAQSATIHYSTHRHAWLMLQTVSHLEFDERRA